jgi:uncharacterized phage infection (PIP) family protein YhgE
MIRCAEISASYTTIIHGEIAQAQQVRVLQVNFKKEVQAWKDILLRGKDDAALTKYETEFHLRADGVQTDSADLASKIGDSGARTELEAFRQQHALLDSQYEAALTMYRASRDFSAADTAVKGKDRPPTNTLDLVSERLKEIAEAVQSIQQGTEDVAPNIKDNSLRVDKSVTTADTAAQSLNKLGIGAAEVREEIVQITQAAREQSQASNQAGRSMNEIAVSLNTSSEGASNTTKAAGELVRLASSIPAPLVTKLPLTLEIIVIHIRL